MQCKAMQPKNNLDLNYEKLVDLYALCMKELAS